MDLTPTAGAALAQNVSWTATDEEMAKAFPPDMDTAARDLFAKRFSPQWETLTVAEKLDVCASIAKRVEEAVAAETLKVKNIGSGVAKAQA